MKVLFIGNVLDVVFMDNSRLNVTGATDELYSKVMQMHDDEEGAKALLLPFLKEEQEIYEEAINFEKRATQYSELKRYGDVFIFHAISDISVPKSVVEAYVKAKEEKNESMVKAILNFWTLACNHPDSRVRNNIFWYCEKYGIRLTESGLLKLYRNVVVKEKGTVVVKPAPVPSPEVKEAVAEVVEAVKANAESKAEEVPQEEIDLTVFISSEFIRVRTKAKKNPANFTVIQNEEGVLMVSANEKVVAAASVNYGNLKELYNKLGKEVAPTPVPVADELPKTEEKTSKAKKAEVPQELPAKEEFRPTIYTDAYTRQMHIQIGQMVTLDRSKCDHNQENTCSKGLHCASKKWLQDQGSAYLGDGKASLLVLVNPLDIVAIPPVDGYGKLRTCAYLPVKALVWENREIVDDTYDDVLEGEFFENVVYGEPVAADENSERYVFQIPKSPEINSSKMKTNLEKLKQGILSRKQLK